VKDRQETENLLADLDIRLEDELLQGDLEERPLGATVAKLCKRLGVTPDSNDWRDTAWAAAEADQPLRPRLPSTMLIETFDLEIF
jgi:hypothetical protein